MAYHAPLSLPNRNGLRSNANPVCNFRWRSIADGSLEKLATINERRAKIVEMRFFAGMTEDEVAIALDVSKSTVQKQWAATSRWLRRGLSEAQAS